MRDRGSRIEDNQRNSRSSIFDPRSSASHCTAETFPGLETLVREELQARLGAQVQLEPEMSTGSVFFRYEGKLSDLLSLRRVVAVSLLEYFALPRPKALLGHQHFERLIAQIQSVLALHPAGTFRTFRISAAGENSAVFTRLKQEIAARTHLQSTEEASDLLLAIRPATHTDGWEVAIRLSPRPLAARAWRVCNLPGALNAAVASCMVALSNPKPDDRVLNLACGSGTLLIERLAVAPAQQIIGCDTDPVALVCTQRNLAASEFSNQAQLEPWDARHLPLADSSMTTLYADLPFGALMGSHQNNVELYPAMLNEAARIARAAACFVLITQEVRLMDRLLAQFGDRWRMEKTLRITIPTNTAPMKPCIYILMRNP